ncbi:MAG: hypothetical protein NT013_03925 [Planctomycetia bacterium]|nr:hypothetical protein [Planctomycetia bacterium]
MATSRLQNFGLRMRSLITRTGCQTCCLVAFYSRTTIVASGEASTGLQYNRARWYAPAVGRFVSEDPIGFSAEDTNLYRYGAMPTTDLYRPSAGKPTSQQRILDFSST